MAVGIHVFLILCISEGPKHPEPVYICRPISRDQLNLPRWEVGPDVSSSLPLELRAPLCGLQPPLSQ